MKRVLEALDVDYDQWRVLTRTLLRMDFRTTGAVAGTQFGAKTSVTTSSRFISLGILYVLMGAAISALVFVIDDVMASASITLTYVMFMVGMMVLVDHQSVITSPDDYLVLGPRPVSSRTYFAVRVTNVLVYAVTVTTLYGALPMLSFTVAHGFHPMRGVAAVAAFYLSALFVSLGLVFSYASLLRIVGADRLSRVLSYAQLIIGIGMYAGYLLPGQMFRLAGLNIRMPDSLWVLLFPPTWFASYIAMASGAIGLRQLLPAAAAIASLVLLARALGGRLSLDYASRLGAIASATASTRSAQRRGRPWLFRSGEHRVVSLLVRAQFRNDQKFRMAVLGVLPLTVVYMFMTFQNGHVADPFGGSGGGDMMSWMPLTMAVLFFPMMLRSTLAATDAHRASWIYFGTPVSRARILRAQTDVLMTAFIVPYICMVGGVMGYVTGHPAGVFTHIAILGLVSRLMLQAITASSPVMPFSKPPQKLGQTSGFFGWLLLAMIFGALVGPLFARLVYVSMIRTVVLIAVLVATSILLDRLTRARLGEEAEQLEFQSDSA